MLCPSPGVDPRVVYTPYLSYDGKYTADFQMTALQVYRNSPSFLDHRLDYIIPSQLSVVLLLVSWVVKWCRHSAVQIGVHYFLTWAVLSLFFYDVTQTAELVVLDRRDAAMGLTMFGWVSQAVAVGIVSVTVFMLCKG
jgi:hypothetical protein